MKISFFLLLLLCCIKTYSQKDSTEFSILFYNVENLFDIIDDPDTNDEEFTPGGDRHWTYKRLNQKLLNLSKVIVSAPGWNPPDVFAMCEIENRNVLELLLNETPLNNFPYKIVHKNSPDERGIDIAFVYNEQNFYPLEYSYFQLKPDKDSILKTREILYVSGIANKTDTLHLFFNHWPSRYAGLMETRNLRFNAASTLYRFIQNLNQKYSNPKIIIMGDFNDQPFDESITSGLQVLIPEDDIQPRNLVNLSSGWKTENKGTLKYQSQWYIFDQIIVSGSLLNATSGFYTSADFASISNLPFLIETDKRWGGTKPKRTYTGFSYNGGFSDHLPVLLKLKVTD